MIQNIPKIIKKGIILFYIIIFVVPFSYAEEVGISARVSVVNNKPEIISITPSFSPVVLGKNTIQTFSIQIRDIEGDNITYTITPQYGTATPISGTITNSSNLQNSQAFINFTYLSTNDNMKLGTSKITITLNDGTNSIVTQDINIYTF